MKRMNVEFADDDYRYLRERAVAEGRTVISVIREAVARMRRESFDAKSDPMWAVGSFDGPSDLAERHDDYLYG